jgi:hypothetical protein
MHQSQEIAQEIVLDQLEQKIGIRTEKAMIIGAAAASLLLSVAIWFFVDKDTGLFVGIWVPSILSLGSFLEK